MNRKRVILLALILGSIMFSCKSGTEPENISLIPKPVDTRVSAGSFTIKSQTPLLFRNYELESLTRYAAGLWQTYLGFELGVAYDDGLKGRNTITLSLNAKYDNELGDEGYILNVKKDGISITGNKPAGILYGIHTIYQLLSTNTAEDMPLVYIKDYPRFGYRGLHFDVSRHFHPIEFIYKLIDQMVMHKLNVFHWHLIDDQGWRLEIKKYPKLTSVGAWRVDMSDRHWNSRPLVNDPARATYGGYYTQEEVKALVAYAAERNITVMPEIEMPAHVMSALAAYPEFSCTGENLGVPPGGVWPITHIYCAGNDATFEFLENVLLEVMEMFPSEYIHIGGDEADKTNWNSCPKCQARIENEGLADEEELQSYFITRIEKFLNSHGRKLMGWDEILEGGLAPNATVMSWRGEAGGIEAAKMGHTVVMTPGSHCYFDHYQGDPDIEPPAFGGFTTLAKVYSYEPIPAELTKEEGKLVLGAQANVWTEYMPTSQHVEYMIFPRLAALSEVVWSPKNHSDWGDFSRRMQAQYKRYAKSNINYSLSAFQVKALPEVNTDNKTLRIELETEVYEPTIRYTIDGSDPDANSTLYEGPFEIDRTTNVKAAVFQNDRSMKQVMERHYNIHKAFGAEVNLEFPNSPTYDGHGQYSLVNGIRGSRSFSDGTWMGFRGDNMVATIDLGEETSINHISIDALQTSGSWIFLPQWVSFEVSADGQEFEMLETVMNNIDVNEGQRLIKVFATNKTIDNVRFIKVTAKNQGVCPPGHSGEGQPAWLFVSEIVVE
jgi:hexosaminidase